MSRSTNSAPPRSPLAIFLRFLRFGAGAWGGPAAQIAELRRELVDREGWVDADRFRRALAVYQALPGPEAHELCCWLGMIAGGRAGALAAGLGFMLPGLVLMLGASWLYVSLGTESGIGTDLARAAFAGVQAAVVGLVLVATIRLTRSIVPQVGRESGQPRSLRAWAWCFAALGAFTQSIGAPFWIALLAGGIGLSLASRRRATAAGVALLIGLACAASFRSALPTVHEPQSQHGEAQVTPTRLFAVGLTGGLVTFGGAYTAIPVVRDAATGTHGWIDESQFLDGLAIGGVLPAPLVIFVTFVGYLGGGLSGALLMTLGMFLPAFSFTLIGHEFFERLVARKAIHAFLDGVACAVCGVIAATAVVLFVELAGLTNANAAAKPHAAGLVAVALVASVALQRLRFRFAVPLVLVVAALAGMLLFAE